MEEKTRNTENKMARRTKKHKRSNYKHHEIMERQRVTENIALTCVRPRYLAAFSDRYMMSPSLAMIRKNPSRVFRYCWSSLLCSDISVVLYLTSFTTT